MIYEILKFKKKLFIFFYLLTLSNFLVSEIFIDGILDEEEWSSAKLIDDLVIVQPNTLEKSKYKTEVLYFANEKGIYFGFKNFKPPERQTPIQHKRDAWMADGDRNFIIIDFVGNGNNGYSFGTSLGDSVGDGTVSNENQFNQDWDGVWFVKTSQDSEAWYSEFLIPWDVAPISSSSEDELEIKIRINTFDFLSNEWSSFPAIWSTDSAFLSKFEPIRIKNYARDAQSDADFYPYISISQEQVTDEQINKIGGEIFWSIDAEKRLDVTINPDFGQVESDDVIVNFDSTETYYEDRRPFFTENQNLFQITGWRTYLINTRRIGAAPDYDCNQLSERLAEKCLQDNSSNSDIDLALRYTQSGALNEFGIFSAFERGTDIYKGRNFQAIRYRRNFNEGKVGYLLTYADKPNISRSAQVHTFDYEYFINQDTRFFGMLSYSDIDDPNLSKNGSAIRALISKQFTKKFSGLWAFSSYGKGYDINDMGYSEMKEYMSTGWVVNYREAEFDKNSPLQSLTVDSNGGFNKSASGIYGGSLANVSLSLDFKDFSSVRLSCECFLDPGKDYMETRGFPDAPYIRNKGGYTFAISYEAPETLVFIPSMKVESRSSGYEFDDSLLSRREEGWGFNLGATVKPTDNLNINLGLIRYDEDENWSKFEYDNVFGYYHKKKLSSSLSLGYYERKHELRIKAQFYSLTAEDPEAFFVSPEGKMKSASANLNSFELSQVAFQIRYRYELAPLSHVYVVYTRGGDYFSSDMSSSSFEKLYTKGWDTTYSDQFIVKIRYRFSS